MTAILLVLSQKWTSLDTGSYWHRRGGGVTLGFAVHLVIGSLLSASMPGCVEAELEHEHLIVFCCIFHIRIAFNSYYITQFMQY